MKFNKLAPLVWMKGRIVPSLNPSLWRADAFGNLIYYYHYGRRDSEYGWEIDHIFPLGPNQLWNLQPLQWYANVRKSNYTLPAILSALFNY
jgi:hypothetical protein